MFIGFTGAPGPEGPRGKFCLLAKPTPPIKYDRTMTQIVIFKVKTDCPALEFPAKMVMTVLQGE